MQLTVVGLNHQTAPLSIREKLAFAAANLPDAVSNLARSEAAEEAVILSTCNRTELYCVGETEKIIDWLAQYHDLPAEEIRPYLYTLDNNETVRHAFRVACGLDSMVLGEPQILGQIKEPLPLPKKCVPTLLSAKTPSPWLLHRSKWQSKSSLPFPTLTSSLSAQAK